MACTWTQWIFAAAAVLVLAPVSGAFGAPEILGSARCPDFTIRGEAIGEKGRVRVRLLRPEFRASSPEEAQAMEADFEALLTSIRERILAASRTKELASFIPVSGDLSFGDVSGGRNLPARDQILTNEGLVSYYLSHWFGILAGNNDPMFSVRRPQLKLCVGFIPGGGFFTLPVRNKGKLEGFYLIRGIKDFSENARPGTLDSLWEYAELSHEFGHVLLFMHQKDLPSPLGKTSKWDELRADCISGYMMGTILSGPSKDAALARIERGYASLGGTGERYGYGTARERVEAARSAFLAASQARGASDLISLTSGALVSHCVRNVPGMPARQKMKSI